MLMTNGNIYVAEIGIPAEVHLSPTFRDSIPSQVYFGIERGYWEVLLDEDHLGTQRPVGLRVVAEFSAADRQDAEDKTIVLGEKLGQFTSFYGGSPEHAPQLKRLAHTGSNRGILEQNVYFYFGDRDRLRQIEVKPYEVQKFLDRIGSLGEVPRQALELASSWYLNSLSSKSELDGYLAAWVGLEALGPLLDSFYHPGGQKLPCSVCGNRAGVKRNRKLAGIEHMIHRSAPELLAGRSVVELEQIRHEIAHCLKPQNQLVELTDHLLRELQLSLSAAILTDISHIKPGASKEPIILDIDDSTDTLERCQTHYRAYWTTFWCGGWWSIGWESHSRYTMAPFQSLQARTSLLVAPHHLR